MSTSSTHSATVVATETVPTTTIIPMHLEHHTHHHHPPPPPPLSLPHTTNNTSTSTVSSGAAAAAALLQTTNLSCDTQTPTATHSLVAAPQPQPTTIYVQNYATATTIIVHPSDNATTTYMAKITALPPS